MATSNSNNLVNPNAREAMNRFKMEAAAEVGVCIPYRNNFKVFRQDEAHITYGILKLQKKRGFTPNGVNPLKMFVTINI